MATVNHYEETTNTIEGKGKKITAPVTAAVSAVEVGGIVMNEDRRTWEICEKLQVRSTVWKHFWIYKDHKFGGAVCKHCYNERHSNLRFTPESWEVKYGGTSANTSHLERHFRTHHKDLYVQEQREAGIEVPEEVSTIARTRKQRDRSKDVLKKESTSAGGEGGGDSAPESLTASLLFSNRKEDSLSLSSTDEADNPPKLPFYMNKRARYASDPVADFHEITAAIVHSSRLANTIDYDTAWQCLNDERKCRYPKSVSMKALLEEMGVYEPKDLKSLEPDQINLFALILKPAPQKAFRDALQA